MKLFTVLFLLSLPAVADDWTTGDKYREATYLVLHTLDWRQTLYIAEHPREYFERNPFVAGGSRNPSDSEINRYFIASGILHIAMSHYLPKAGRLLPEAWQRTLYVDGWRSAFQYISIGVQAGVVARNYQVGVKIVF